MVVVRHAKILLVSAVAFLGLLGIFNFLGWERGFEMVYTIVSMTDVPGRESYPWATSNPLILHLGVLFIAASKVLGGVLCAVGAVQMWLTRGAPAHAFQHAKRFAVAGCTLQIFLFFFGFMYLANQLFMGWQTELGAGAASAAFQLGASVALVLLFVSQPEA